jgi:hypothetical protein
MSTINKWLNLSMFNNVLDNRINEQTSLTKFHVLQTTLELID